MIQVELITPERLAFKDQVDFVAAPAADGEIGVLPNHAPLLARLGAGDLRLKKGDDTRHVAVTGGFIEVQRGSRVSIFAETAEFAEEINIERERLAAEQAKSRLAKEAKDLTAAEVIQLQTTLNQAMLKLHIARVHRPQGPSAGLHS